jgi:hypothetical protein
LGIPLWYTLNGVWSGLKITALGVMAIHQFHFLFPQTEPGLPSCMRLGLSIVSKLLPCSGVSQMPDCLFEMNTKIFQGKVTLSLTLALPV